MPSLHLFHRRTILAGDDLQLPSLAWGSLNAFQLFVLLPMLLWHVVLELLSGNDDDGHDTMLIGGYSNDLIQGSGHFNISTGSNAMSSNWRFYSLNSQNSTPIRSLQADDGDNYFSQLCQQNAAGSSQKTLLIHLYTTSVFCAISLWYEQRIYHTSSLGTPTLNIELRQPLSKLMEQKLTYLNGYNLLLLVLGIMISTELDCHQSTYFFWIPWLTLLSSQAFQILVGFASLVSILRIPPFDRHPLNERMIDASNIDINTHHEAEELWRVRCEGCCRIVAASTCYLFGGRGLIGSDSEIYGDIARALADYTADFGVLDVVPSDVGLGIVVLRHMQAQRRLIAQREALGQQQFGYGGRTGSAVDLMSADNTNAANGSRGAMFFRWRNDASQSMLEDSPSRPLQDSTVIAPSSPSRANQEYQSFSRPVLSPTNLEDALAIQEGAHFARHQLAIYTWILYYYEYPVTGTFRLMGRALKQKMHCSNPTPHLDQSRIVGDNFLRIHEATMLAHAGLKKSDIAYASFEAGLYETPYCIIIDREWKTIVLSIRGSLTLEDCVVDVLLDPNPLDSLGEQFGFDGRGQYCHGGVYECTQWLYNDLERHKILDILLLGENPEFSNYTLRIVGHSLGAGIGVILSLMLRNKFSSLHCLCFSPPGGFLTWELATSCSDFVNSFVLDSDIVPRLSFNNMERQVLRDEVFNLIARVKLPKYEIAKGIFFHSLCGEVELGDLDYLIQQNDDLLHPPDSIPDSEFLQQLRRFEMMQQNRRSTRGVSREVALFPPGNIIHLVKTGQNKSCAHSLSNCITCGASNSGAVYTPVRKENDDFNEIQISPSLWTDHFPNKVCIELERVAERFGTDSIGGGALDSTGVV